jgi:hypothetical protein
MVHGDDVTLQLCALRHIFATSHFGAEVYSQKTGRIEAASRPAMV